MDYPVINQKLGCSYGENMTVFRLWSPLKDNIHLLLYKDGETINRKSFHNIHLLLYKDGETINRKSFPMEKEENGVHKLVIKENLKNYYYTYLIDGDLEVTDPYSIASSLNSNRSAIIDIEETNPWGWEHHPIPRNSINTNAIIYETHVKDFSFHKSSGVENKGKFLGLAEIGTKYNGVSTGLSHLKELGITHIHLLPIYDFLSVKEEKRYFSIDENYNWGYDPELYNVVEGSYATIPEEPINRIKELKQMIMTLHEEGIKVIIDVVYNHTYRSVDSNFNIIMPGYYHRMDKNGHFSDGSGCGNEIASEKSMVRKFILDSVIYWVDEFKIDGLRFDLMALTDKDTMGEIVRTLRERKPDLLIYGEPWAGGRTTLPHNEMTLKGSQTELGIAFFNDDFRDAVKGDNNGIEKGFSQGNMDHKISTETGIAGSIYYDDSHIGFTNSPIETINYINAHDDLIIYDKMRATHPHFEDEGIFRLNKFAFSILFTAQGIPFIHGGNEFLRSKMMMTNTYNHPSSINNIDWSLKENNLDYYNYFRDLIKLRKSYSVFRMTDAESIRDKLKFLSFSCEGVCIAYTLSLEEENKFLLVVHNANYNYIFIPSTVLIEHLHSNYQADKSKLIILPVLDLNGMVPKKERSDEIYPHGVEIEHSSTAVFELILKRFP